MGNRTQHLMRYYRITQSNENHLISAIDSKRSVSSGLSNTSSLAAISPTTATGRVRLQTKWIARVT